MIEKMPNLAGIAPWVPLDFRSPVRMLPGVQDYHNRKMVFYTLQKFYGRMQSLRGNNH